MKNWINKGKQLIQTINKEKIKIIQKVEKKQSSLLNEKINLFEKALKSQNSSSKTDFYLYYKKESSSFSEQLRAMAQNKKNIDFSSDFFQELIDAQYQQHPNFLIENNSIFAIAVVGFHHKRGSEVEFIYPKLDEKFEKDIIEEIKQNLSIYGMPDACHQNQNDFVYFNISVSEKENHILYGITSFKQITVTMQMKELNPELTRNQLQKSICILSEVPIFGSIQVYFISKLTSAIEAYFLQNDLQDFKVKTFLFLLKIKRQLKNSLNSIDYSELFISQDLKSIIMTFKEKILIIWKAILLEYNILVFSQKASNQSNFILAMLSLFPGALHFQFETQAIKQSELALRDFGLPLRVFNSQYHLYLHFTINQLNIIEKLSCNILVGTTNQLIKEQSKNVMDVIINLDSNEIDILNESIKTTLILCKSEKQFIKQIMKKWFYQGVKEHNPNINKNNMSELTDLKDSIQYNGSDDWIRNQFGAYIKDLLVQTSLLHHYLSQKEKVDKNLNNLTFIIEYLDKKFNHQFYTQWIHTRNFQFWTQNHDPQLYVQSQLLNQSFNLQVQIIENGDIYLGQLFKGMKEGEGLLFERSQKIKMIYQGEFVNNKKEGKGTYYSLNKGQFIYEGEFQNDKKHGFGNLIYEQQFKYSGQFYKDLFHGEGTLIDNKQNVYNGQFQYGKKQGNGIWKTASGWIYEGQFYKSKFHGKGRLENSNHDVYQGEFIQNRREGEGTLIFSNGESYIGMFKNDKFHGAGILKLTNGDVIEGEFLNGSLRNDVDSIIKYNVGNDNVTQQNYVGKVGFNKPNGLGTMEITFQNGQKQILQGIFENGKFQMQSISNIQKQMTPNKIMEINQDQQLSSLQNQINDNIINQSLSNGELDIQFQQNQD